MKQEKITEKNAGAMAAVENWKKQEKKDADNMKTSQERISALPIIKSKKTASKFANLCDDSDWTHTFGLELSDHKSLAAWSDRKSINADLRKFRKEIY